MNALNDALHAFGLGSAHAVQTVLRHRRSNDGLTNGSCRGPGRMVSNLDHAAEGHPLFNPDMTFIIA